MIRTLAIGILSTFILACEKLPDPVVPDTPREENNEGKEEVLYFIESNSQE